MKDIKTYNPSQVIPSPRLSPQMRGMGEGDTEGYKEMLLEVIGRNIKKLRLKKKLTQEQVSEAANINPKYLGEVERGEKSPSGIVVYKLSQALNVSVCKILSGDNCPCIGKDKLREVEKLFAGKRKRDIEKALKILEVFFE